MHQVFHNLKGKKLFQIRYCGSFANLQKYKKGIMIKGVSVLLSQNTNKKQVRRMLFFDIIGFS